MSTPAPTAADTARAPLAAKIVAAYLENYITRQVGRADSLVFGTPEPDALTGLLYLRLAENMSDEVSRAVARREVERLCAAAIKHAEGNSVNVAGWVLTMAVDRIGSNPSARELAMEAVRIGGEDEHVRGLFGQGWRAALLTQLLPHLGNAQRDSALAEIEERLRYLGRKAAQLSGDDAPAATPLFHLSRLSTILMLIADPGGDPQASDAARALVAAAARHQRPDGSMPRAASTPEESAISAHIAELALAADRTGDRAVSDAALSFLLKHRLDTDRHLIRSEDEGARYEFIPWVPIALASVASDSPLLSGVLNPRAAPLPDATIRPLAGRAELTYSVETPGLEVERVLSDRALDELLAELTRQIRRDADDLSARLLGHLVIGIYDVAEAAHDDATVQALDELAEELLERIRSGQSPDGGWRFGRANVPSMIYGASSRSETEFPDLEYSIDASVPGIALARAFLRHGDERNRAAVERAFAFFERRIGRIVWNGRPIWLLYPGDEKTPEQGTAVNYELWAGSFFSLVGRVADDEETLRRAATYVQDAIDYTEGHLHESGDINYGDYVTELRTPYASWDAYLLAEIARHSEDSRAQAMSVRILERVGQLVLPSGLIPNVVEYQESVEGHVRWLVHRHGIGPYPARAYYQLYFVGACAAAGAAAEAALRALGFVLLAMHEPVFVGMSTGHFSDGRFDDRPDSLARVGRDWLLIAIGSVAALAGTPYRPRLRRERTVIERMREELVRMAQTAREALERPGAGADIGGHAAVGSALATIARLKDEETALLEAKEELARIGQRWDSDTSVAAATAVLRLVIELAPAPSTPAWALGDRAAEVILEHAVESRDGCLFVQPGGDDRLADLATHAESVGALARWGERGARGEIIHAARAGLRLLLARQAEDGLWSVTVSPARRGSDQGRVLAALAELSNLWEREPGLDEALLRGAERSWEALFHGGQGRGYANAARREPMRSDQAAAHAFAFAHLSEDSVWRERSAQVTRYLLHTYRDLTGLPTAVPRAVGSDPRAAPNPSDSTLLRADSQVQVDLVGRVLRALALVAADHPDVFDATT